MARSPQTFRPAPKGPGLTFLFFAPTGAGAILLATTSLAGRGTPALWLYVALLALLGGTALIDFLDARVGWTTADDEGITAHRLLGTRIARWGDVTGHDVLGNSRRGVRLWLRDGRRVSFSYLGYGDELRRAVESRLAELPPPSVEGREFRQVGRWSGPLLGFGFMGVLCLGSALGGGASSGAAWIPAYMLGPLFVPLTAWGLTDRAVLRGGVLTKGSVFGQTRLVLADVRRAEIKTVHRRRQGMVEKLVLTGPDEITLDPTYEGYAMLRDAVIAELRPSVRPEPLA